MHTFEEAEEAENSDPCCKDHIFSRIQYKVTHTVVLVVVRILNLIQMNSTQTRQRNIKGVLRKGKKVKERPESVLILITSKNN